MPHLEICSLARLKKTVETSNASHLLTLINAQTPVQRPASIHESNHLYLAMSDILEPLDGHILPGESHLRQLLSFVRGWDRANPMVIHCYAGVSRSTAAAFITACALNPDRKESDVAALIRARSPTATPNLRLVAEADDLLGRAGALLHAAKAMGRGQDCFEGIPFRIEL
ncbi:MAG: tyrosine phosphatase family protein [Beijerinckiaceae bacterium]